MKIYANRTSREITDFIDKDIWVKVTWSPECDLAWIDIFSNLPFYVYFYRTSDGVIKYINMTTTLSEDLEYNEPLHIQQQHRVVGYVQATHRKTSGFNADLKDFTLVRPIETLTNDELLACAPDVYTGETI